MTSGRPAIARAAVAGSPMSAANASTFPENPSGRGGTLMSVSVNFSMARPLSWPSLTRRAVSLRPIMPAAPVMRMCIVQPPAPERQTLHRHPAIDEMGLAGDVACFVAGEKQRERRDFLRRAEPAHRLAGDEILPHRVVRFPGLLRRCRNAVFKRRRLDRTRTNRVAANALSDEVGRDRLGQPDHGGLGGAVGITVGYAANRRYRRRDVDDRAGFSGQHSGKKRLDHAMHRFDVEVEGKIPVLLGAVEYGPVGDIAGAIDQD